MILIVSHAEDPHAREVISRLNSKGCETHLLDFGQFPSPGSIDLRWDGGARSLELSASNQVVDLGSVAAVWWRRVRPWTVDPACDGPVANDFARSETTRAVFGAIDSLTCPWINDRAADDAASSKVHQWSVAGRVGLRIPRTIVTNRPSSARSFLDCLAPSQVIYKPLEQPPAWRETRLFEEKDLDRLEQVRLAPVVLQEYVPGIDVRATVVDGQCFAASIDATHTSYPLDMRVVLSEAQITPVRLPSALVDQLRHLMGLLGLVFGAIDLRIGADGTPYFLEVNPAGQWLFAEEAADLHISDALAEALARASRTTVQ